jgi:hypothetical protein
MTVEPGRFTVTIGASSEDIRLEGSFHISDGEAVREQAPAKAKGEDPVSNKCSIAILHGVSTL